MVLEVGPRVLEELLEKDLAFAWKIIKGDAFRPRF